MTPATLGLLLTTLAVGIVVFWLGWRGRRIDRAPTCRSCAFDLTGVLPDGKTCPECGAGLARPRAVRTGNRRRLWSVAAAGLLLTLTPLGILGLSAYTLLTGGSLVSYMPVPLLLAQASHGNETAVAEAGTELLARLHANALSDAQAASIVDSILEIQADPSAPWHESLGDIVETTRIASIIDKQTFQRFLNQAIVLGIDTRPAVAVGDPVPIRVVKLQERIGSISGLRAIFSFGAFQLGETELDLVHVPGFRGEPRNADARPNTVMFTAWGTASNMTSAGASPQTVARATLHPPATGPHTLTVRYRVEGQEYVMGRSPAFGTDPSRSVQASVSLPIRIVPEQERRLELIPASDELHTRLVRDVGVSLRVVARGPAEGMVYLSFDFTRLPFALAHEVLLVQRGAELPIGHVVRNATTAAAPVGSGLFAIEVGVPVTEEHHVTVVLRPNPMLATGTVEITEMYGGEIVFDHVQIERQ